MNFWQPDVYAKAWHFATKAHQGQFYGGHHPEEQIAYNTHLASVAMEIMAVYQYDQSFDANFAVQCALLHDTLEDTSTSYESLQEIFGLDVANGVLALSKDASLPKDKQLHDSLQRIKLQPREIWMVKLADRITNLYHPPFYWDAPRILAYQAEAGVILNELGSASIHLSKRLSEKIVDYRNFIKEVNIT